MDKERSGVPEGAREGVVYGRQVSLEAYPVRQWRERAKGQKRWDQNSKGTKSRGFLGAQQAAAGDEKTGAQGRSAREAH